MNICFCSHEQCFFNIEGCIDGTTVTDTCDRICVLKHVSRSWSQCFVKICTAINKQTRGVRQRRGRLPPRCLRKPSRCRVNCTTVAETRTCRVRTKVQAHITCGGSQE